MFILIFIWISICNANVHTDIHMNVHVKIHMNVHLYAHLNVHMIIHRNAQLIDQNVHLNDHMNAYFNQSWKKCWGIPGAKVDDLSVPDFFLYKWYIFYQLFLNFWSSHYNTSGTRMEILINLAIFMKHLAWNAIWTSFR